MKNLLFSFFLVLFIPSILYAGTTTLTTYYPAPTGNYNQITANKQALGTAAQPTTSGDVTLQVHGAAPPSEAGVQGEIAYGSNGYLYVNNGSSTWIQQGGDSGSVTWY